MRFDQPVGTDEERNAKAWAGGWFDATGYGTYYTATGKPSFHTGADLNLTNYRDSKKPIFASGAGEVVHVGKVAGWQGIMIVIKHDIGVWTRYAHTGEPVVTAGQVVKRGELLAYIGDYAPAGPANDHLHFDVSSADLGAKPWDWPGTDLARLKRDYMNPKEWINTHRGDVSQWTAGKEGAPIRTQMNTDDGTLIGTIPAGGVFNAEPVRDGQWLKVTVNAGNLSVGGRVATWEPKPFFGYVLRMAVEHAG